MASDSHHPLIERLHPRDENEDYYAILGCDRTATVSIDFTSRCTRPYFGHCIIQAEQITAEYRVRAKRCHPDSGHRTEENQLIGTA